MLYIHRPLTTPTDLFAVTLRQVAFLCIGGALAGALLAVVTGGQSTELPKYNLINQDAPVLLLLGICLLVAPRWLNRVTLPLAATGRLAGWGPAWLIVVLAACIAYAGAGIVFHRFPLSLDEFMAAFDAKIIASGHLLAPVAPEWQPYVKAMQPMLQLQVPGGSHWASTYLPMNAAIHAFFLSLGDAALANALLAAVALLALYGVARQMWPSRPDAAVVAVLLLASSSQFLITAMTPYAMTAHLALNLVWLWLFLRDTKYSHALAVVVAFVTCGLHQVVFHPLFAAPFLLSVLRARRWKLAGFYAASYAAIGIFWLLYWTLVMQGIGEPGTQSARLGIINLIVHILYVVDHKILATIPHIALLLFRFVAWQSPLLIPLAMVGFFVFRKQNTVIRDLALGFAVMLTVLVILVPFQGHGWGYRYVHGLLGSIALLAAQGWICLTEQESQLRRHTILLAASVGLSFFVILPWYGYQARTFLLPYEAAAKAIANSDAQVVIVDPVDIWYGIDLARNDPFLKTSPKIMVLGFLQEDKMRQVCRDYDTALFDRQDADRFGLLVDRTEITSPDAFPVFRDRRRVLEEIKCGRPIAPRKQPG